MDKSLVILLPAKVLPMTIICDETYGGLIVSQFLPPPPPGKVMIPSVLCVEGGGEVKNNDDDDGRQETRLQ